jgi:predicted  nucleic acid-binding Zn-ribbon protein
MNANELTALISECLRETDDHEFFLKLESVLRQQQAEIDALKNELDTANKAYMWMDETYKGNLAEIDALKAKVKQWEEWKESLNGWSKK